MNLNYFQRLNHFVLSHEKKYESPRKKMQLRETNFEKAKVNFQKFKIIFLQLLVAAKCMI